jgi:hypothetical protein
MGEFTMYVHFIKGVMLGAEIVHEDDCDMLVFDFLIVRLIFEFPK